MVLPSVMTVWQIKFFRLVLGLKSLIHLLPVILGSGRWDSVQTSMGRITQASTAEVTISCTK